MHRTTQAELLDLTTNIVVAYSEHNEVEADTLPDVVRAIYQALAAADAPAAAQQVATEPQRPAVPIRRSVFPDHIVCLEDGKKLTMLKRYLHVRYSMTPDDYRRKWGLPSDYPMVAPDYARARAEMAKSTGLGRK